MKSMENKTGKRFKFYIVLLGICGLYWLADSIWSFLSFEKNLQVLIYSEPASLFDTLFLKVSPYQVGARLMGVALFFICGALIFEFMEKKRRAETAYIENEKKYRKLIYNANEAIFIINDGKILFSNPKASQLTGYSIEELKLINFIKFIHPKDVQDAPFRNKTENSSLQPSSSSYRVINRKNEEIWVQCSATNITWDHIDAEFYVLRDITEEKKLAEQLARAEKMEAVGILAGGVAHDLNNILSGLVSYPDLLLMDLPKESPLRNPIITMQDSGKKAAMIVQDLLTLARRGVSGFDVVNLNSIISEYLDSPEFLKLKSFHPEIKVRNNFAENLMNIMGSRVHLSKTVMNLVSNAAEAMPKGGTISISTENRYLDKPVKDYDDILEGDYAVFIIKDTGEGINSEDMHRIFEPFYTKKNMGRSGTGLGMAVVWGTVKDHNGYINIESTKGKGTKITIFFPVTRQEKKELKAADSISALTGNGEKILVVDDIKEQQQICTMLLARLNYDVSAVSSGEEAVIYVGENSVDLVILDMIMEPGIDGLETYRLILDISPGQKAVIASGFSETEQVKELQRLGAGEYIKKPYTLEKIGQAVKKELARNKQTAS